MTSKEKILQRVAALKDDELDVLEGLLDSLPERLERGRKIAELAGSWADWPEEEYQEFLKIIRRTDVTSKESLTYEGSPVGR